MSESCIKCDYYGYVCQADHSIALTESSPACDKFKITAKKNQAPELRIIDEFLDTDVGNGKRLAECYNGDILYCYPLKTWFIWDGTRWKADDRGEIYRMAKAVVKTIYNDGRDAASDETRERLIKHALKSEARSRINAMVEMAQSEPTVAILPSKFDSDPMLFNVQNGTIDLRTGVLRDHRRDDYITKISPVPYNPAAKYPRWDAFLDQIFQKNKNIIGYIQRKAGYILSGETFEEDLDILYGTGGNGKSTLTEVLIYIVGDYHKKASAETIQENKNKNGSAASPDVASLKGARLVTVSEPEKGLKLNESRVKDMTGRDTITARHLHQEPFDFKPQFKLWIYTNHKPIIGSQDRGIWRRIKLVPFEVSMSEEEQDKQLDIKLQNESSGILNWLIKGCLDWQKNGLQTPQEILEATADYKEEMDVFSEFFKENCIKGKGKTVYNNDLYKVYRAWCIIRELIPFSNKKFVVNMVERGFKKLPKDDKGIKFDGLTLSDGVTDAFNENKTLWGNVETDELTHLTQSLLFFYNENYIQNNSKKCVKYVSASEKQPTDTENNLKNASDCLKNASDASDSLKIVEYLHKKYDTRKKPDTKELLEEWKQNHIIPDLEMDLDIEDGTRYVNEYCKARGWE